MQVACHHCGENPAAVGSEEILGEPACAECVVACVREDHLRANHDEHCPDCPLCAEESN